MLRCKSAFCKRGTHLILCIRRKFLPQFLNTTITIFSFYFLLKITKFKVITKFNTS